MTIPSASAPSERLFSGSGKVEAGRPRLSPDTIEAVTLIKDFCKDKKPKEFLLAMQNYLEELEETDFNQLLN